MRRKDSWQQSLSVLPLVFSYSVDIHDKVLMGCSYCFTPFHPFMVSWVHMFMHTNSEGKSPRVQASSKLVEMVKWRAGRGKQCSRSQSVLEQNENTPILTEKHREEFC